MGLYKDAFGQLVIAPSLPSGGSVVSPAISSSLVDIASWFRSLDGNNSEWHPSNYYGGSFESPNIAPNDAKYNIPVTDSVTGIVPKVLCSLEIISGSYTELTATFGCIVPTDTASIEIRTESGTLIKSLTWTGLLAHKVAAGFSLITNTQCYFYLRASTKTAKAVCVGIQLK